jgi:hypothetical protein
MKALLTIAAVCLFTLTTMAADRYPTVTIKSKRNYEVVVDGRRHINDNNVRLERLNRGMHNIRVYERRNGLFGSRLQLVTSRNFFVRNNDIRITIGYNGFVDIDEMDHDRGRDRNWKDDDHDRRDNDRDWKDDNYDRTDRGNGNGRNKRF